jgi:mannose-1-phosphate guanylyltransferase
LESTVARLDGLCEAEQISVFTNQALEAITRQQLNDDRIEVIGEPAKRDTAPCVALSAAMAFARDPQAVILTLPADHVIEPIGLFHTTIRQAVSLVEADERQIVTLGIPPTYPAEVYGYIERADEVAGTELATYRVKQFREKPDAETAAEFLRSGGFFWNAGIFIYRASTMLAALRTFEPELMRVIDQIVAALDTPRFVSALKEHFQTAPAKSIDYAVMERYPHVTVIVAPFAWDDVGNWLALERLRGTDTSGNMVDAQQFLGIATKGTLVHSSGRHLIVTVGIEDLIVVHTPDATLVANKQNESALREVVKQLESKQWTEFL